MWYVYILYSITGEKTYTGFTNHVERRLHEHNITESKGFTLRYRPWTLIRVEPYQTKAEAMAREKFLKTGCGLSYYLPGKRLPYRGQLTG